MKSVISWTALSVLFVVGLAATVASGVVLDGTEKTMATVGGAILSLLTGATLGRREPLKSFLSSRPVLWFLFLFNLTVAASAPFVIEGPQGIGAAIGMGVVSLGAGIGLLQKRTRRHTADRA